MVWLRFEEAFWRSGSSDDGAAASDQAAPIAPPDVLTVVGTSSSVAAWLDIGRETGEAILVGVIAATQAPRLESLDDQEFQTAILADLAPYATARG